MIRFETTTPLPQVPPGTELPPPNSIPPQPLPPITTA